MHFFLCPLEPRPRQYWRGLSPIMQLHLNRPAKRAGEAGKALRASNKVFIYFRALVRWWKC
ncbi:hypothetical protein E0L21_12470 [Kosakonia quasisacchari]|uniref:Uncharacterized protein n=1 Tax=Kosakonia quasisacchari TaxID=2529380 RepID=A0A4R0HAB6_9ENTR|nr:hypothetical protein E0L21_12470 [Kosakonia quasisacchari]